MTKKKKIPLYVIDDSKYKPLYLSLKKYLIKVWLHWHEGSSSASDDRVANILACVFENALKLEVDILNNIKTTYTDLDYVDDEEDVDFRDYLDQ